MVCYCQGKGQALVLLYLVAAQWLAMGRAMLALGTSVLWGQALAHPEVREGRTVRGYGLVLAIGCIYIACLGHVIVCLRFVGFWGLGLVCLGFCLPFRSIVFLCVQLRHVL